MPYDHIPRRHRFSASSIGSLGVSRLKCNRWKWLEEDMMQDQRYRWRGWAAVAALPVVFAMTLSSAGSGQSPSKEQSQSAEKIPTKVVLLGTGTPRPYPDRSGA